MASRFADWPIQLREDEDEDKDLDAPDQDEDREEAFSQSDDDSAESESTSGEGNEDEDTAPSSDPKDDRESSDEQDEDAAEGPSLADISFGALAKAQETFEPKPRKRKFVETQEDNFPERSAQNAEETFDTRKRAKEARLDAPRRSSKHAPTIESARKPVSRRRIIFDSSASTRSRDPRFDPTVMSDNRNPAATERANKNYSFLSQYQAEEILALKSQIKKAKDPSVIVDLKRQVMSMESKIKNAEARQQENAIRKKHKEKEKEALRNGRKAQPYFLKEADVKRLAKEERLSGLGKKARDKADKRRQKREKGKDARDMPRGRRERVAPMIQPLR